MSRDLKLILISLVAGGGIGYGSTLFFQPDDVDTEEYKDEIKRLEQKIDSLHSENIRYEKNIERLVERTDSLERQRLSYRDSIDQLQIKLDEDLTNVDTLSDSQLSEFFTERYNRGLPQ